MIKSSIKTIQPLSFPWATQDPFLFCVHHNDDYPNGNEDMTPNASLAGRNIGNDFIVKDGWRMYHGRRVPGFPYHPHRGFETVTITKTGLIDHADSMGAAGRFGNGDVQWMTAGRGVQHAEMFPMLNQEGGNKLEFFQLWLNLPSRSKMVAPHFNMIWSEDVRSVQEVDGSGANVDIDVITGRYKEVNALSGSPASWASDQDNEVAILTVRMDAHAEWKIPTASKGVNRTLYFYQGNAISVDGTYVGLNHAVELDASRDTLVKSQDQEVYLLMLQGRPINEPIAQHGPFVMNTQEEIQEAFSDFTRTQFGGWPWPQQEQVHDREKGRFALYADGKEEIV